MAVMLSSLVKQLYASGPENADLAESLGEYKKKGQRPDTKTLEDARKLSSECKLYEGAGDQIFQR